MQNVCRGISFAIVKKFYFPRIQRTMLLQTHFEKSNFNYKMTLVLYLNNFENSASF